MTPTREMLRNIPLFNNLSDEDLTLIAGRLHKETYLKGTMVFKEGDDGETMYLVESGQLAVVGRNARQAIAFVGPGNFVGETSLLLAEPRTASLQVTIDATLWALHKRDFEELVTTRASIAAEMLQEIGRRLVATTKRRRRLVVRRITALWGNEHLALAQTIQQQLKTRVALLPLPGVELKAKIDIESQIMLLQVDDLNESSLAEALGYQVEQFKHIVIILPPQPDALAYKAINLADTVVTIGPPPKWIEENCAGTDLWPVGSEEADIARIARRLTNRTVGVALSSGGTRGLAHVGVLKVFMEENIPIDLIAGTSGGALFGTLVAAGWDYKQIWEYIQDLRNLTKISNWDFNLPPKTGIAKGKKVYEKYLVKPLGDCTFEALKIPMFIVAADILSGQEIVFDSGSVAHAIRASASIPIWGDPWHYRGRYLVDGGIVNPLPANILRDHGADIVLASSVVQPLAESYNGSKDKMPNVFQTLFNVFSAMEAEVIKKQLPLIDVLIQHDVSARSTLDFTNVEAMILAGEQAARPMVSEIRKIINTPPE